jgi:nucleotide-binding universal stress UspA family protein
MIPKIEKILYTTDLSQNSEYVFGYAMNLAIKYDATLIVLYVIEPIQPSVKAIISTHIYEEYKEKLQGKKFYNVENQIKEKIEKFCRQELKDYPDAGDGVEAIRIYEGYPADIILEKADSFDCDVSDVIVMGSHGKGIISQTFLGSVSRRVLRRTRKPVFINPLPRKAAA